MEELTASRLGSRIRLLRERNALSLNDLAESSNVAKSSLSKIENGEVRNPGLRTLAAIAKALSVTVRDLLERDSHEKGRHRPKPTAVEFEMIATDIPSALREFLRDEDEKGDPVPQDAQRALMMLKFRGKRPSSAKEYGMLYEMLRRLV